MSSLKGDGKAILIVFIGAIIAVTFVASIADSTFAQTNTITITNVTVTAPAVNGTLDLTGRSLISETAIVNASNASLTSNGMFLQTGVGSNGLRTVQLTLNDTASGFAATSVNVSYTAQPDGYLDSTSTRTTTLLIPIFAALAILIFVIVIFIRDGSMGKIMRRS